MATPTYELIETTTLTADSFGVTFTSIPQSYRDLVVVWDVLAASGSVTLQCQIKFNGDTGSNYNDVYMRGDGTSTNSASNSNSGQMRPFTGAEVSETVPGMFILQVMDYSATDKHKSVLARSGATSDYVTAGAGRWADTSAITSILIEPTFVGGDEFASGGTFSIYGIAS